MLLQILQMCFKGSFANNWWCEGSQQAGQTAQATAGKTSVLATHKTIGNNWIPWCLLPKQRRWIVTTRHDSVFSRTPWAIFKRRNVVWKLFFFERITRISASQSREVRRVARTGSLTVQRWEKLRAQKHFLCTTKGPDSLNPPFEVDTCRKVEGRQDRHFNPQNLQSSRDTFFLWSKYLDLIVDEGNTVNSFVMFV